MNEKKKFSISETLFLLGIGCIFELVSVVPGLNVISTIVQWVVMLAVFHNKGVSYIGNKKILATTGVALLVGLIPVLSALPEFIFALSLNIRHANKTIDEDNKKQRETQVQSKPSRITRITEEEQAMRASTQGGTNNYRMNTLPQTNTSSGGDGRPKRTLQFARTYTPVVPRRGQDTKTVRVLSASGAMLKNEERNS